MSENQREVFRTHAEGLRQYVYFLLAATAAAIAFAVNQTRDARLEISHLPLGCAVLFWGVGFYLGCRHLHYANAALHTNLALLQVEAGTSPLVRNPTERQVATEIFKETIDKDVRRGGASLTWSFRLLIAGAVCFVLWHVLQMYSRTIVAPLNV